MKGSPRSSPIRALAHFLDAALLVAALALAPAGCGPSPDAPLPPETDLYVYSIAVAEKARTQATHNPNLGLYQVGKVHERFGLDDKALDVYERVLALEPNFADAYRSKGFLLSQRKDRMAEAIAAYQQCLRCDPGAKGILTRMGLVFTHMGKLEEAIKAFDNEIRDGFASGDTFYNRGQVLTLQGKHEEAIASYGEALKIAPDMRSAYYALAQAARAAGKESEAQAADARFAELKTKEDAATAAAGVAKTNRDEHLRFAAETWLDAASILAAEANASHADKAVFQSIQKQYVMALGEAIRLAPKLLEPRRILIEHLRGRGDLQGAAQACKSALDAQPKESTLAADAYDIAGRILESYGRSPAPEDAIDLSLQLLQLAVVANPDFADGHRETAKVILFRRSNRQDLLQPALGHAVKAVELDGSAMNYDILALAYHRSGRPDLARRALERGIELHPDSQQLRDRLEKLNATQGN